MFAVNLQMGKHMWASERPCDPNGRYVSDKVDDHEGLWNAWAQHARACGANTLSVDVAEMLHYPSHPEIWLEGGWSAEKMNGWVRRMKALGFRDVVPSLNFSAYHCVWLGEYSRMISTRKYYQVCRDLLKDVYEIFDRPPLIHFGMDEEHVRPGFAKTMPNSLYVVRQGELYWHDNLFFIREIEKLGARAWMWADKVWWEPDEYVKHIPKSALQSNWFYGLSFDKSEVPHFMAREIDAYDVLERHGYDQVPGCSHYVDENDREKGVGPEANPNIAETFRHCGDLIAPERLKGFYVMSWEGNGPEGDRYFRLACDQMRDAIAAW